MIKVRVINESEFDLPEYETKGSAGVDLKAVVDKPITIKPLERALISSGLSVAIPEGYEAQIRSRSGLAINKGIAVLNSPGTIDSDYRGVIFVILINLGNEDFVINNGDRIAQMVLNKYEKIDFELVESLDETERGDGGFGHTGV